MSDVFASLGGMFDLGLIGYAVFGGMGLLLIAAILFLTGRIGNTLKTKSLNFEKRQGACILTDMDMCGTVKMPSGIKYKMKTRNMTVNPPDLQFINRLGNQDLIFMYWPSRSEAYPFLPKIWTADEIVELANNAFKAKTAQYGERGELLGQGHTPETLEEFKEALGLAEEQRMIFFEPVVDESSINLLMAELATLEKLYTNQLFKFLDKYGMAILMVLAMITFIGVGLMLTDKLGQVDLTCVWDASMATAQTANPLRPEVP